MEVALERGAFPIVALSMREEWGVIQSFLSPNRVALLTTAVSVCDETLEMPVLDTQAPFSPEFVRPRGVAYAVVEALVRGTSVADLGVWQHL